MIRAEPKDRIIRMSVGPSKYFRLANAGVGYLGQHIYWYNDDLGEYTLPTIAPTLLMVWE